MLSSCLRKYSVDKAPLVPVLKFSTDLTVFFSRGTLVPPEVTKTTVQFMLFFKKLVTSGK